MSVCQQLVKNQVSEMTDTGSKLFVAEIRDSIIHRRVSNLKCVLLEWKLMDWWFYHQNDRQLVCRLQTNSIVQMEVVVAKGFDR